MIQSGLKAGLASAMLLLTGCAEMAYNARPQTMKLADADTPTALILGQAYQESAGHYNILIVKSVDGVKTFSGWESRTPCNWYVPAGQHKFTAHVAFGNFARSLDGDRSSTAMCVRAASTSSGASATKTAMANHSPSYGSKKSVRSGNSSSCWNATRMPSTASP